MRKSIPKWSVLLLVIVSSLHMAFAQANADNNTITSARLFDAQPPLYLDIMFSNTPANAAQDLLASNVHFTTSPETLTPPLAVSTISLIGGTPNGVRIVFSNTPPVSISSMQVCLDNVTFSEASGQTQTISHVCSSVQIITPAAAVAEKQKLLQTMQAVPKTNQEKNIFGSGFITTASSGTQGGLDLNLNSNDLGVKGMTASLQTIKTSLPGGDPQNFEVGMNFSNAYVFGKAQLAQAEKDLRLMSQNPNNTFALTDYNTQMDNLQDRTLSALLVDFSGRLEGGATSFNVVNYVGDGEIALQSRTKTLFTSKGYWQFRLVPFGLEGGKNVQESLTTGTTSTPVSGNEDAVARLKGGATLALFYDDPQSLLPFKRIELNLYTVQRYLFLREAEITSAKATPIFQDGYRPWYEADLLVYLAEMPSGRYGFRLAYTNGSLPPSFAITKSFQFGFVFETADNAKSAK